MMSVMSQLSRTRARAVMATALSLFLLGSNYCLLAVAADWAGGVSTPDCHVAVAAEPSGSCCSGGAEQAPPPAASAHEFPCCMKLAPATAPTLAKAEPVQAPAGHAVLEPEAPFAADVLARALILERAGPDPSADPRLPRASRAPPLS